MSETQQGQGGDLIFLIAGEASGDVLGARLMAALKDLSDGPLRFAGIGGNEMAAQGLDSLFPMSELAVMGLVEVVPRIPRLLTRIDQTTKAILRLRPAVVVTIDAPAFCLRVAARLRSAQGRGAAAIPVVHYVAPQVWAWRPGRAAQIARLVDHLLVLLPFEAPFFEKVGLPCTTVGHPVVEGGPDRGAGAAFRARHAIAPETPVLCVLPGSRHGEVRRLLPVFGRTLARLARALPGLHAVAVATPWVRDEVAAAAAAWPVPATVAGDAERMDAFAAGDVALAASGTVTLELALAGVPMVVAYRMNPVTGWLARRLVTVQYATLINLVLGRAAVPELLLGKCRPKGLAAAVERLFEDPEARAEQRRAAAEALARLGRGGPSPSRRAAQAVLAVISSQREQSHDRRDSQDP